MKPQGEFPVPLHQNRRGGGGESGRRGAMECPSRRIVFGYRTTKEGGVTMLGSRKPLRKR